MEAASQLGAVLLVFALLGFTLWWLRKRNAGAVGGFVAGLRPTRKNRTLERIEYLQLSPAHSLNLVRMADRAILIGISPQGFCVVESAPFRDVVAESGTAA